ncbi:MAG TPA: hypothetical protein PLU35_01805 [Phycisphaerales bacterium]|nr:hypothetical protein [Phycisphaerales bacterium]
MTNDANIAIEPGTMRDYDALAVFHYRAGPPATVARGHSGMPAILRARDAETGSLVGVLVVSMPTLNGSWRELAWPGRYSTADKRRNAARINAELRCISRVVVDPRWRGLGVAGRLVRAYLENPLTLATEALAAMGSLCPFFERAGMTPYTLPPASHDARLLDALWECGVEPWSLLDPPLAQRTLERRPWLERELRAWARGSPTTRRHAAADAPALTRLAAARVSVRITAYAAVREK